VNLLSVLEQNPEKSWQALLGQMEVRRDHGGVSDFQVENEPPTTPTTGSKSDDDLTSFKL
jgi:hypothetical protein